MESSFGTRGRKAGYFFRSQWQIKTIASFIEEKKAKRQRQWPGDKRDPQLSVFIRRKQMPEVVCTYFFHDLATVYFEGHVSPWL